MTSKVPIILAAFGTTTQAMGTYGFIDAQVKAAFPSHAVKWAYTSRMVRAHMNSERRAKLKSPRQILDELAREGHTWAVVQSLHMICGHEFYRLVDESNTYVLRTSIGLPLLTTPADYRQTARALAQTQAFGNGTAHVLIGHGTDHPAWAAYPTLARILENGGGNVHVATIEEAPHKEAILSAIMRSGASTAHLVPLMLVAGVHLQEDIAGKEDSWKSAFESAGLTVTVEGDGLGKNADIIGIYVRHIREALDAIPRS